MADIADKSALRDAAAIVLLRESNSGPQVLMGQRGAGAAFMPEKFVFPGGALDQTDAHVPLAHPLNPACAGRLAQGHPAPQALAAAAIRELWEEAGLRLGTPGCWEDPPADWAEFAAAGLRPNAAPLRFFFRAITPPGRPRRFDARFFLAPAEEIAGDPDDFSAACDELSHLHWVDLAEARKLNLPFITEIVLAEAEAIACGEAMAPSVPFFDNATEVSQFRRIA